VQGAMERGKVLSSQEGLILVLKRGSSLNEKRETRRGKSCLLETGKNPSPCSPQELREEGLTPSQRDDSTQSPKKKMTEGRGWDVVPGGIPSVGVG